MDSGTVGGVNGLTPRMAVGALALVTANVESQHHIVGFTSGAPGEWFHGNGVSRFQGYRAAISPLPISPRSRLDDVCHQMAAMPMGGTDCAAPMLYALDKKIPVDAFYLLTDNETWAGTIHPCQALTMYRQQMNPNAKLIVIGMTATASTIGDTSDAGVLECVGFDTATPQIMAEFVGNAG